MYFYHSNHGYIQSARQLANVIAQPANPNGLVSLVLIVVSHVGVSQMMKRNQVHAENVGKKHVLVTKNHLNYLRLVFS